jgi:hypothetical protein
MVNSTHFQYNMLKNIVYFAKIILYFDKCFNFIAIYPE